MSELSKWTNAHVKNPLTVIAVFAALAETSSVIALPSLSDETQQLFVWFVMLFPVFLVSLFFLTLWLKHQVLYAPSDYQDEENFMAQVKPASVMEARKMFDQSIISSAGSDKMFQLSPNSILRLEDQCGETFVEELNENEDAIERHSFERLRARLIDLYSTRYDIDFLLEAKVQGKEGSVLIDAFSEGEESALGIEVVYMNTTEISEASILALADFSDSFAMALSPKKRSRSKLLFLVLFSPNASENKEATLRTLDRVKELVKSHIHIEIEAAHLSEVADLGDSK
ncbi:MAG: hypothetical protein AAFM92_04790 [Pseudomonadota bacterium]